MSLNMAALCLDASLEMLRHSAAATRPVSKGISAAASRGSPQALQAVVMLSAHQLLQNSPQSTVLRSALPESQFSALMKARKLLHSHS